MKESANLTTPQTCASTMRATKGLKGLTSPHVMTLHLCWHRETREPTPCCRLWAWWPCWPWPCWFWQ